jgi:hypothetical protein
MRRAVAATVVVALVVLAVGPLLAAALVDDPQAEGKVTAFEAGKSLSVQVGDDQKAFKITEETKIEGELAIGKQVQVWAKDGVATKIVVK